LAVCRFLYLDRSDLPSEEEEYQDAVTTIRGLGGRLVTFRTLDLGGDKLPLGVRIAPGPNPALGLRGIRLLATVVDVLRGQLRALYRASAHGPSDIMFRLSRASRQFVRARLLCDEVNELLPKVSFGAGAHRAMVETPAAALMADRLVARADFLSLGTNDLVQYTLAADRDNKDVAHLYLPQSPAVLRLLKFTADAACAVGKPISVCGDMASHPHPAASGCFADSDFGSANENGKMAPRLGSRCGGSSAARWARHRRRVSGCWTNFFDDRRMNRAAARSVAPLRSGPRELFGQDLHVQPSDQRSMYSMSDLIHSSKLGSRDHLPERVIELDSGSRLCQPTSILSTSRTGSGRPPSSCARSGR
jgi:hypothetical protein